MDDYYYVRIKGRVLGPMSRASTLDSIRRGQILRSHEFSADGVSWGKFEDFQHLFCVDAQATSPEPLIKSVQSNYTAPTADATTQGATWFVLQNGKTLGPMPEVNLKRMCADNQVNRDTLVWTEGMNEWLSIVSIHGSWFHGAIETRNAISVSSDAERISIGAICDQFLRQCNCLRILVGLGFATCGIVMVANAAVAADAFLIASSSSLANIYGIGTQIAIAIVNIFIVSILFQLLRYTRSVSALRDSGSFEALASTLKRLSMVWVLTSIFFGLMLMLCLIGIMVTISFGS